jgi:subtilisin family serine protease
MTVVGAVDAGAPGRGFPSAHPRVIAIVAADDPRLASNAELPRGAILAPGRDVLTTVPHGRWRFFSGASFAAAHATGIVALLLEKNPDLNGEAVRALLAQPDRRAGPTAGLRLDGAAALALLDARRDCGAGALRAAQSVRRRNDC